MWTAYTCGDFRENSQPQTQPTMAGRSLLCPVPLIPPTKRKKTHTHTHTHERQQKSSQVRGARHVAKAGQFYFEDCRLAPWPNQKARRSHLSGEWPTQQARSAEQTVYTFGETPPETIARRMARASSHRPCMITTMCDAVNVCRWRKQF